MKKGPRMSVIKTSHQNRIPSPPPLSRPDAHAARATAVWSLKGPQSGKKLAEAEGAEMILTLCHRSSLLHTPEACKVNRCSFKGREIRVRSTKHIWFEWLSSVDLRELSKLKSAESFRLRRILRHIVTISEKLVCFQVSVRQSVCACCLPDWQSVSNELIYQVPFLLPCSSPYSTRVISRRIWIF